MFLNLFVHIPFAKLQKKLLYQAIKCHNIDYVKSYIKKGLIFNTDVLHYVLEHNSVSIFKLLLKQDGFDINVLNENGNTILSEILIHHKYKNLDYLLKSKYMKELDFSASCMIKNDSMGEFSCQTFIFSQLNTYIQQYGLVKFKSMVMNLPINFNIADNTGNVVLGYLMKFKQKEIFDLILMKTENIFQINQKGENLLHLAFLSGNIDYVERLINYNFDIIATTHENKSYEDFVAQNNDKVNVSTQEQMYILIENKINLIQESLKTTEKNFITNDSLISPLKKII